MFRNAAPAQFGPTEADNIANLSALADRMAAGFDPPKDGPDAEESGIPALYTYLGQFIDHDITFDPVSRLTKSQDPDGLVDFRTRPWTSTTSMAAGRATSPTCMTGLSFGSAIR